MNSKEPTTDKSMRREEPLTMTSRPDSTLSQPRKPLPEKLSTLSTVTLRTSSNSMMMPRRRERTTLNTSRMKLTSISMNTIQKKDHQAFQKKPRLTTVVMPTEVMP